MVEDPPIKTSVMQIEFNPTRISQSESSQPAARQSAAPAASDSASFASSASLKDQLIQIPTIRPEQVERAQSLVGKGKYPPDDILDRIAVLLAVHLNSGQAGE